MSKAAIKVDMSASAVSQHISKLENKIGLSLFNRSTRSLTLTEAGSLYFNAASSILQIALNTHHQLEQLKVTPSGRLKLFAPVGFGGGLLSQPLEQLTRAFPDIKIDLVLSDTPVDIIKEGIDLALCFGPLQDSNLKARYLVTWQRVLCVSCHHPLAKAKVVHPEDLLSHTFIEHKLDITSTLEHETSGQKVTISHSAIQSNNMQNVIQLTLDGIGFGFLPEPEIRHHLQSGQLVALCPQWKTNDYSVYAVTPPGKAIPGKTKAAMECIQACFTGLTHTTLNELPKVGAALQ